MLPANVYQDLMEKSFPLATYCNQILASRFSDVMWVMEQTIFTSLDRRLALFLLEQKGVGWTAADVLALAENSVPLPRWILQIILNGIK